MNVTGELRGAAELKIALKQVEEKVAKSVLRNALDAGCQILMKVLLQNSPKKSGMTRDHIQIKRGKISRRGISRMVRVGLPAFYAGWVNYGHRLGKRPSWKKQRKGGGGGIDKRPFVSGTHWMDKSWKECELRVKNRVEAVIAEGIAQAIIESPALKR